MRHHEGKERTDSVFFLSATVILTKPDPPDRHIVCCFLKALENNVQKSSPREFWDILGLSDHFSDEVDETGSVKCDHARCLSDI
jgi:hypothetical protein